MLKHYWLSGHEWIEDTETGEEYHWPEAESWPMEADALMGRVQEEEAAERELAAEKLTRTDAHELAETFAGFENPDAYLTEYEDGVTLVELTSDIRVFVDADGTCSFAD